MTRFDRKKTCLNSFPIRLTVLLEYYEGRIAYFLLVKWGVKKSILFHHRLQDI